MNDEEAFLSDVALGARTILCPDHIMGFCSVVLRDGRDSHVPQKKSTAAFQCTVSIFDETYL